MRAAAMSVWVFINLLCFGMCGYLYLISSQYWMYIEKQRLFNKSPDETQKPDGIIGLSIQESFVPKKHSYTARNTSILSIDTVRKRSAIGSFWSREKSIQVSTASNVPKAHIRPINIVTKSQGSPRFPSIHIPLLEFDSEKYGCDDYEAPQCKEQTAEFKGIIQKEFHRVLMGDSKVFMSGLDSQNGYKVKYDAGRRREGFGSGAEARCALGRVAPRTVRARDQPFARLGFRIPPRPLQQPRAFNTCAVVTSAGALLGSRLGELIDSHDMVLRFNNAPTENYTEDVGSKTTFRILNSQVISKPEYHFLDDPLYNGVSILIWDPAKFSTTLEEWYNNPDFPLFPVYKKLLEDKPGADVHLLHPQVLWELWTVLQDFSPYRLRRNPPSSGFIGIWFALHRCRRVRVFEYVPSVRAARRCHYYAARADAGCTLGSWHPLAQEKALAERMRDNSDLDTFQRGFIEIPGIATLSC